MLTRWLNGLLLPNAKLKSSHIMLLFVIICDDFVESLCMYIHLCRLMNVGGSH